MRRGLQAEASGPQLGAQCRAWASRSPARRTTSPRALEPSTSRGIDVDRVSVCAPPSARRMPPRVENTGWMSPNSGRGAKWTPMATAPSLQVASRSRMPGESVARRCPRSRWPSARASRSTTVPVSVRKVVSRTSVRGRYLRVVQAGALGCSDQWPAWSSSSRAKTAGLSNRGRHNQSTEPTELTRAAERQSESRA